MEWSVSPILFEWGNITIRWYGLFFMGGFLTSYVVLGKVFERENVSRALLDRLLWYVLIGTVIGARLGHVLFYEPEKYFAHPLEIFAVWHGGLASHGGAIGVLLAIYFFSRKYRKISFLTLLDYVALVIPLAGAFIRFGNLMNSEIIGKPSQLPFAIVFDRVDMIPRHPAQVYEAIGYLAIFLYFMSYQSQFKDRIGLLFGQALALIFSLRFLIEFVKENQVAFESKLPINMGQFLSIPFIAIGIFFIIRACRTVGQGSHHPLRVTLTKRGLL